ncbi:1112_t:CDS:2, partial [Funneliformis caledonium]
LTKAYLRQEKLQIISETTTSCYVFAIMTMLVTRKNKSGKSDDTVEDETKEELTDSSGLIDDSLAGQGSRPNHHT